MGDYIVMQYPNSIREYPMYAISDDLFDSILRQAMREGIGRTVNMTCVPDLTDDGVLLMSTLIADPTVAKHIRQYLQTEIANREQEKSQYENTTEETARQFQLTCMNWLDVASARWQGKVPKRCRVMPTPWVKPTPDQICVQKAQEWVARQRKAGRDPLQMLLSRTPIDRSDVAISDRSIGVEPTQYTLGQQQMDGLWSPMISTVVFQDYK